MGLKRIFGWTTVFFLIIWGFSLFATVSEQVQEIDNKIVELKAMKRGFEGRALRHESQAEYLQFDDRAFLETRRHLQLADENRAKAARVQEEIDKLEAKRQKLLGG